MTFRGALVLFAFGVAASASAQTKISGTVQCKSEPVTPVEIGDKPGHAFAIIKNACTWTTPMEIAGAHTKTGDDVIAVEMNGSSSSDHGYHLDVMDDGDKFTVRFSGSGKSKDGKPVGSAGTWSFVSGTGKVKGIQGKGTYKGTANADGTTTVQIAGEYSIH